MRIHVKSGTTAENNSWTLPVGKLSYDTERKEYRIHDGVKAGGVKAVKVS